MANEQHSLQTYVSDMLALERHIRVPFETQLNDQDFGRYGDAQSLVARLSDLSNRHIDALDSCLQQLGGHAASPIKSTTTTIEGFFAGVIDKIRKTKVSKALRDDYTALALCCAGYTMLQTTATALHDDSVAQLAQQHLTDYASTIMDIGQSLPQIVIDELAETGLAVDQSMAEPARRAAEQSWRSGARGGGTSETGTVGTSSRSAQETGSGLGTATAATAWNASNASGTSGQSGLGTSNVDTRGIGSTGTGTSGTGSSGGGTIGSGFDQTDYSGSGQGTSGSDAERGDIL